MYESGQAEKVDRLFGVFPIVHFELLKPSTLNQNRPLSSLPLEILFVSKDRPFSETSTSSTPDRLF